MIDAWLARNGRDSGSFTALERLLYTGNRGMGALEYAPPIECKPAKTPALELDSLIAMAQEVLDQRAGLVRPIQRRAQNPLATLLQVGTSAGGARAKVIVAVNEARTEIRSGQADAPAGFEHYLLKFDGVVESSSRSETFGDPQGFSRMEYAYYLMAKDAGIAISPSELLAEFTNTG